MTDPADTLPPALPAPESSGPAPHAAGTSAPGTSAPGTSALGTSAPGTSAPTSPWPKSQEPNSQEPDLPEPGLHADAPAPRPRPAILPWVVGLGFVVLAGSQAAQWYLWQNPEAGPDPLAARVQAMETRLDRLEARPAPASGAAAPDLAPLTARVAALEQAARTQATPSPAPSVSPGQVDSLAQRVNSDDARLAALEKSASAFAPTVERTTRLVRIQAAFVALSVGQPLGDIPDAPAALTRYATAAPPTEAALRLAFPAAAKAALAAAPSSAPSEPWFDRMWDRMRDLVTIRQGDRVLVGDSDAAVLARAQTALDAGDLAGAVAASGSLTGPRAQAMAAWLGQANGLLAARAALAVLAAHT